MSDLHLEFGTFQIPRLDTDKETILLLSGDIHVGDRVLKEHRIGKSKPPIYGSAWIKDVSEQFAHVLYIMGNHEHYRGSIDRTAIKIREGLAAADITNVTVLDNGVFEIPDINVKVIGGTMWTDYNKGHPVTMYMAQQNMNDHKYIRCNKHLRKFRPQEALLEHLAFKEFLLEELAKEYDGTIILMTHHAPHQLSINPMYANDYHGNGCYASDLSEIILDYPTIKYWFHGHVHHTLDYNDIGGICRVICNPRGYFGDILNEEFDPTFIISLT